MCHDVEAIVDEVASGERVLGAAERAHVSSCERCGASLALARAMEMALRASPPPTPASLTAGVMRAVRRERWRAELFVDRAFNLALLIGVVLIVLGGWLVVRAGTLAAIVTDRMSGWQASSFAVPDPGPHAWAYVLSVLLLVSTAATWWWVEGER